LSIRGITLLITALEYLVMSGQFIEVSCAKQNLFARK